MRTKSYAPAILGVLTTVMLLLSSCTTKKSTEDTAPPAPAAQAEFVPGEVLVKFKSTVNEAQSLSTFANYGLERVDYFAEIGVHRCRTGTQAVDAAVSACAADPNVEFAEPNFIYKASVVPNDPRFGELWGLQNTADADIDADDAWETQRGSRDVVVAIIDTGVDHTHPDVSANMWRNPGESGAGRETNRVDDDGNGFVDDVFGWDFVNDDNDPRDDNAHGTHVAGTIAAVANNGVGVAGINWQASVMALKFLSAQGSGTSDDAIRAILYAASNGAMVQNNSWGGGGFSQALLDAIEFARDRGVVFVAAAGNDGRNNDTTPTYPANYDVDNVLSVAASDRNDQKATFSNFGKNTVDLAAPGVDILSTTPGNAYQSFSGTSMATPHVSGVVALVAAQFPDLSYRQVMVRVAGSVDSKTTFSDVTHSGGRLNAAAALASTPIVGFVTRVANTNDTAGPYRVQAEATDDGAVITAELSYTVSAGNPTSVDMQRTNGVYTADIPGQATGSEIAYFVVVTDDAGNTAQSNTFTFRVGAGGDEPPSPCGNFALVPAAPASTPRNLAVLGLNLAVAGFALLLLRRLTRSTRSIS